METLTGVMIAVLIFYSGKLMAQNELDINNFFSFLAAMMLAYQPVRSLSTLNMVLNQGLSAASRILPIIDNENKIYDNILANLKSCTVIIVKGSEIKRYASILLQLQLDIYWNFPHCNLIAAFADLSALIFLWYSSSASLAALSSYIFSCRYCRCTLSFSFICFKISN